MGEKICRLCLRREGEFFDLFAPLTKEKTNLVEQLEVILNFEIVNDARLPASICSNCHKIQEFINDFKLSCSRVNCYLNELLKMSPAINGDGLCGQVSSAVRLESNYDEIAEEKLTRFKPLRHAFKDTMKGDKHHKKHKPNMSKKNKEKISCHLKNDSMINKAWNQSNIIQTEGVCKPSFPWSVLENDPSINEISGSNSKCLESKAKHLPTTSSISGKVEEITDSRVKNVDSDKKVNENDSEVVVEFCSWEDEDTVELKFPLEGQQKSPALIDNLKENMNETVEECPWSFGGKQLVESPVKSEVVFAESVICLQDLKEAPKIGSRNIESRDKEPNQLNIQAEKNPSENTGVNVDINKAIYSKLLEIQNSGVRITTEIMKSTALKVSSDCGMPHFTASNGWLHSFIKRYEIGQKTDEVKLPPYCSGVTLTNGYITRYCCKELNEAVYIVCREIAASGVLLHSNLIKDFARSIAFNEGLYEFSGSTSWFKSFKKYYNIEVSDIKTKRKGRS